MMKRINIHLLYTLLYMVISILLISCNKIKNAKDKVADKLIEVLLERPVTEEYSLFDKFPEWKKNEYNITKVKGIKCDYIGLFYKYYFRYSGDRELIKQYISNIQCHYTEIVPDTTFIETTPACFELETQRITKYEYEKAKFFYSYKDKDLKDLKFYTCIKTPEKHFIIFDLKNNLIYHMIGNFRE